MRIILFLCLALVASCSSTLQYNDTVFPYEYNRALVEEKPIQKVVLAPVSLGAPVRSYLEGAERKTRSMVKDYLEANGFEVLPGYHFENAWKQANRTYGDVYDPTTGKIDTRAWRAAMVLTGEKLRAETEADAIVFADLVEHDVQHSPGMTHYARWYGVTRKPETIGGTTSVPMDFNWAEPINAASLMVTIFNVDLERVFTSRGGISTLEGIDSKKANPSFVRLKTPLRHDSHIEEGIELAFHPFIKMQDYPKPPEPEE